MAKKRILVIDDDEDILMGIQFALVDSDYDVTTSLKAKNVEQLIQRFQPNLIILDVLLSGADGREVCRSLKAKHEYDNIPIMLISAQSHMDIEARKCGANAFLAKPFDLEQLLNEVSHLTS
ncbi:MAG: PleD family two-component system response regulator [Weeksellaceae bacterium]